MLHRRHALQLTGALLGSAALSPAQGQDSTVKPAPIKFGQIGTGHGHAADTLRTHRESPDFELVGVVEPDEMLRRRAERHPAYRDVRWMTEEELLNTPGLTAVLVETRVGDLLDAAEASVAAGMHVHLDKPAGESLPQYERIMADAERQQLVVQMGYIYRHNPGVVMLREFLERGWLGEVFEVHGVMGKVVAPEERKLLAPFAGGTMFELGCHLIDVVVAMLGVPESVTSVAQHVAAIDDGLADNMLAVLTYPKAIATVKSSAVEVEGFRRRHLVVCGTEGSLQIQPLDNPGVWLALSQRRGEYRAGVQEVKLPRHARYVKEAAEFARAIRSEAPPLYSYEHDLAVHRVVLEGSGMVTD